MHVVGMKGRVNFERAATKQYQQTAIFVFFVFFLKMQETDKK